jgi:hypothetical protein
VLVLERYALHPDPELGRSQAIRLLNTYYPESQFAAAAREWATLRDHSYFGGGHFRLRWEADRPRPEQVPQIRAWLDRYPNHPGRDDALAVLAINISRQDPIEALRLLHAAYHAPDGDKQQTIAALFRRYLTRLAPADPLQAWLETDCPEDLRGTVRYALAVKRLREHRFAAAAALLDETLRRGGVEAWGMASTPWPEAAIRAQAASCRWLLDQDLAAAAAPDAQARAAVLHAMARRCFREEDLFRSHLFRERTVWAEHGDRAWPRTPADLSDGDHYEQARRFFAQIAREHPTYREIEAVEYSLPLCLWRLRRDWPVTVGGGLDRDIAAEFQAFADRHPRSSMADDALYLAGIHSFGATQWKDDTVLRRNFARIVEAYPDGDILTNHVTTSDCLQRAVVARRFPELEAALRLTDAGSSRPLPEAAPTAGRTADRP